VRILQILDMYHPDGEEILNHSADVIKVNQTDEDTIIKYIHDVDAVVLRSPAYISSKMIENAPNLKVISGAGVGIDNIDVSSASDHGVAVLHAPNININATAEHTLGLILSLLKQVKLYDANIRDSNFGIRNEISPLELQNRNIGLVGWGKIARRVAEICKKGFNMNVMSYVRSISQEKKKHAENLEVTLTTDLEEIFVKNDIISVHLPLTSETEGKIDDHFFSLMKSDAYFINTSRGKVINEEYLYNVLLEKRIAGAALDVFNEEPLTDNNPLISLDNTILTPHVGGISLEAAKHSSSIIAKNVIDFLEGSEPNYIANPEVLSIT